MRALVFLFTRTLINGVRRALTSPKRMISLIVFGLYYYFALIRPFAPTPKMPAVSRMPVGLAMPDLSVVDGVVFGVMALGTIVMISSLLSFKGGFRPADVDVLFATPISPRLVLGFRIIRDYLFTLLAPLVFVVLGWRGTSMGLEALFRNYPAHAGDVLRMGWIAWMLMALGWVSLGHGASLFVNRSDVQSTKNGKIINYGSWAWVLLVLGYVGLSLRADLSWDTARALSQSPVLRTLLFPATASTAIVMGSLRGNFPQVALGLAGSVAIIAGGFGLALTQVDWLYDQAAARGFGANNLVKLRRSGDTFGLVADRARQGKVRRGRIATMIARTTVRGPAALLWKEQILQARGPLSGGIFIGVLFVGLHMFTVWALHDRMAGPGGALEIAWPCTMAYMLSLSTAHGGFLELLRRVDLQKPLPFSPSTIVFWEALAKTPMIVTLICVSGLAGLIIQPMMVGWTLAGILLGSGFAVAIVGSVLLAVMLFPDHEDPTQRGLRGLLMLLCIVVASSPGAALFGGLLFLEVPPIVAAIPATGLLVAITAGLAVLSGSIYAGYNPSE